MSLTLGYGGGTLAIPSTDVATTVWAAGGTNVFSVGSPLSAIAAPLTINAMTFGVSNTLNISDSTDASAASGTLTSNGLTGLGLGSGGISYNFIDALNLTLGTGSDTLAVSSTVAPTTITAAGGTNIYNVGDPSSGIGGNLTINGAAATCLISTTQPIPPAVTGR